MMELVRAQVEPLVFFTILFVSILFHPHRAG